MQEYRGRHEQTVSVNGASLLKVTWAGQTMLRPKSSDSLEVLRADNRTSLARYSVASPLPWSDLFVPNADSIMFVLLWICAFLRFQPYELVRQICAHC